MSYLTMNMLRSYPPLDIEATHRASGVQDFQHALLPVDLDLLTVGVLDGGIVLLDENSLERRNQNHIFARSTTELSCLSGNGAR